MSVKQLLLGVTTATNFLTVDALTNRLSAQDPKLLGFQTAKVARCHGRNDMGGGVGKANEWLMSMGSCFMLAGLPKNEAFLVDV